MARMIVSRKPRSWLFGPYGKTGIINLFGSSGIIGLWSRVQSVANFGSSHLFQPSPGCFGKSSSLSFAVSSYRRRILPVFGSTSKTLSPIETPLPSGIGTFGFLSYWTLKKIVLSVENQVTKRKLQKWIKSLYQVEIKYLEFWVFL